MNNATAEAPTIESAREGLKQSLGNAMDWGQFKSDDSNLGQSDSPATEKTPENRSDSEGSDNADNKTSSQPQKEEGTKSTETDASNRTDTTKTNEQPKQRAPARIQELLELDKTNKAELQKERARIQELERKLQEAANAPKKESEAKEPEPLVPPPQKPAYTKEQLKQIKAKARAEGDELALAAVEDELEKLREYELDMVKWEHKNGQAVREHQGAVNHYRNEALKKWPDLGKSETEQARLYAGIRGYIAEKMPQALKNPETEYVLGQLSEWQMRSIRLDAAESENKTLREENEKLKKGSLPISSTGKVDLKEKQDASDPKAAKEGLMGAIRSHLQTSSYSN